MFQKHRTSPVSETFGCSALGWTIQAFPAVIAPSQTRRLSSVCILTSASCRSLCCLPSSPSPASSSFLPSFLLLCFNFISSNKRAYSGGGEGTLAFVWTKLQNRVPYCVRVPEFGGPNDMAFNMVTGNFVVHF